MTFGSSWKLDQIGALSRKPTGPPSFIPQYWQTLSHTSLLAHAWEDYSSTQSPPSRGGKLILNMYLEYHLTRQTIRTASRHSFSYMVICVVFIASGLFVLGLCAFVCNLELIFPFVELQSSLQKNHRLQHTSAPFPAEEINWWSQDKISCFILRCSNPILRMRY